MSIVKFTKNQIHKMESVIRDFLWGNGDESRKIYLLAWDKITTPFKQGGLGIIKPKLLNKAMLAKQFWRIISDQDRLVIRL